MTEIKDGRSDFDFFHGRWHVAGRKLADNFDRECTEWIEFDGVAQCRPILGGLGNVDTLAVESMPPGGSGFHGATLRLFHPQTKTWKDVLGDDKAQWAQRFSWDGGATWDEHNFLMMHTRLQP